MNHSRQPQQPPSLAWWRYGYVWLVIAGPLAVVLASLVTLWLALAVPDPVLNDEAAPQQRSGELAQAQKNPLAAPQAQAALTPAVQARNRLTTPAAGTQ